MNLCQKRVLIVFQYLALISGLGFQNSVSPRKGLDHDTQQEMRPARQFTLASRLYSLSLH
jgi:hypothetical protein